jgi:hypothetical protein
MGFPSFKNHYASILAVLAGVIFLGQGQSPNQGINARPTQLLFDKMSLPKQE